MNDEKPRKPQRNDFYTKGGYQDALITWRQQMVAWRVGQRQARKQVRTAAAISAAFGIAGAINGGSLASGAMPGEEMDAYSDMRNTADVYKSHEQRGLVQCRLKEMKMIIKRLFGIILLSSGLIIVGFSALNQMQNGLFASEAYFFAGFLVCLGLVFVFNVKLQDVF